MARRRPPARPKAGAAPAMAAIATALPVAPAAAVPHGYGFGPDVVQVETAPGEKPRYRVKARSMAGVVPAVSNYLRERQPVVSPFEAASQSDTLPNVQNIGPNDIAKYMRMVVAQARQLYRTQGDIRGGLKRLANEVIGTGPKWNPRLPGMRKILKRWLRECDASG
ncbi:MAG: hypothetical protein Q7T93_13305 [Methylobacterium sp.]|uniref:hypothetical protein n=1 Tax=Methylobacterium sp. TaxID=409 RepID=UPI00271E5023|nr:hypothetical protein [Methylobacterium sp.]MDO9427794.1 hypothetical protein [Methylobacterium sp.]